MWLDSLQTVWPATLAVAIYLGVIVITAEALRRLYQVDGELTRKVVHIGTGNVILFAWWGQIPAWVGITCSITASVITLVSYRYPILPGVNSVGRKSLGTFFYAVSIGLLVGYFWPLGQPEYAAIGILTMSYGDGLAALIGQRWGKHRYQSWGSSKSWEGSLTMLVISGSVSVGILGLGLGLSWLVGAIALATALVATALETWSWLGIDNLTVPLGAAFIAYWLSSWL